MWKERKVLTSIFILFNALAYITSDTQENLKKYKLMSKGQYYLGIRLRAYCQLNNATDEAIEEVMEETVKTTYCLKNSIKPLTVREELLMVRPFGINAYKKLFAKYCNRASPVKTCLHALTKKVPLCMTNTGHDLIRKYDKAVDGVIHALCAKEGENIALFYANGGVECFMDNFDALQDCSEYSFHDMFWKECGEFTYFTNCVLNVMKECKLPYIEELTKGFLEGAYRGSPCGDIEKNCEKKGR